MNFSLCIIIAANPQGGEQAAGGGAGISSAVKGVQEGMGWDVLASCGTWGPCLGLAAPLVPGQSVQLTCPLVL